MDSPIVSDILAFLVLIATKYCVNSTNTSSRAAIKLERFYLMFFHGRDMCSMEHLKFRSGL